MNKTRLFAAIIVVVFAGAVYFYATSNPRISFVNTNTILDKKVPPKTRENNNKEQIALTFDDGPYGTSTAQILSILEQKHVPATFFVMGKNVERFPEEVQRMVRDGHLVGNHSYNHEKNLAELSREKFKANLDMTEEIITRTAGTRPVLFRPPYGLMSETMKHVLEEAGYTLVLWNVDPRDWDYASSTASEIVQRVEKAAKPNAIILLHDGRDTHVNYPRDNTVAALPKIIDGLENKGYTFVTVDKIISSSTASKFK